MQVTMVPSISVEETHFSGRNQRDQMLIMIPYNCTAWKKEASISKQQKTILEN